jgi:hypothetical protein
MEEKFSDALEQIAKSWDGCMYDAPGETMDIGASLRRQFKQLGSSSTQAAPDAVRYAALEEAANALCHWVEQIKPGQRWLGTLHYGHLMRTLGDVQAALKPTPADDSQKGDNHA